MDKESKVNPNETTLDNKEVENTTNIKKEDNSVSSGVGKFLNVMAVLLLFVGIIGLLISLGNSADIGLGIIILVTSLILSALLMGLSEIIDVNLKILLEIRKQNNNKEEQ